MSVVKMVTLITMKKEENSLYKFESLTDFHRVFGLPKPLHPLISFIDIDDARDSII